MARIVVTGGFGFIGRHTINELVKQGYDVAAVDKKPSNDLPRKVETVVRDITIKGGLNGIIEPDDKVLHLAAVTRFELAERHPYETVRTNVLGTMNVIQTCIERGAERLVFSSSGSVYGPNVPVPISEVAPRKPKSLYGLTKKIAEDLIFFHGGELPFIILRYGYIYGKGKDWGAIGAFLKSIQEGTPPTVYGGRQTIDFICVEDVVQANLLALESPHLNQAYNIGSGIPVSIMGVCDACIKAMNVDVKPLIKPAREFDFEAFVYNISKARSMLGFEPQYGLEGGIRSCI